MSAYVCDKKHIVFLVQAAISHRLARGDGGRITWRGKSGATTRGNDWTELSTADSDKDAAKVANMLWQENVKSVCARYPDEKSNELPGTITDGEEGYIITAADMAKPLHNVEPVQVLKSISCYEYQACEHEGWETSEAHTFCQVLRHKAINTLAGYDDAEWGAPKQ